MRARRVTGLNSAQSVGPRLDVDQPRKDSPMKDDSYDRQKPADTALVPVNVEGWTLFESGEGGHWVRDLDLAERAGLVDAHKIRGTIKTAIVDGAIGPHSERANDSPCFREVSVVTVSGKGRKTPGTEYYLNETAALLILMRLRTPKAVEVTKAVVRVYLAVTRGEYVGPRMMRELGDLKALVEIDRQENELLRAKVELLDPMSDGTIGEFRANVLRSLLRDAGRMYCATMGIEKTQAEIKERDNELRMHLSFPQGVAQRWELLPVIQWGHAMQKVHEIVGREKNRQRRLAPVVEQLRFSTRPGSRPRASQ